MRKSFRFISGEYDYYGVMAPVEDGYDLQIVGLDGNNNQTETPGILQGDVIGLGFRINHGLTKKKFQLN
jgi:hypothetical protein